jgi:hypothetical protein
VVSKRLDSSDQIPVGQPPAGCAVNEAFQPSQRMTLHVAFVESERELVDVPTEVLRADMMIGAIDAALQDSPNAFDAVCRDTIPDELSGAVVDRKPPDGPWEMAIRAVNAAQ